MPIVDSQVHIWAANTPERPWPARHEPHKPEPITAQDLLREMDGAGVNACVLVPPSWEGERNDVCLAAAQKHPKRFAVMGRLDPDAPESRGKIAAWRRQPGMLGLRFTMHRPFLRPLLTEGRLDWLWPEAEKAGVPVMVLALPAALRDGCVPVSLAPALHPPRLRRLRAEAYVLGERSLAAAVQLSPVPHLP